MKEISLVIRTKLEAVDAGTVQLVETSSITINNTVNKLLTKLMVMEKDFKNE